MSHVPPGERHRGQPQHVAGHVMPVSRRMLLRLFAATSTGHLLVSGCRIRGREARVQEHASEAGAPELRSGVTLTVMNWSTGEAGRVQRQVIDLFTARYPGIRVEFTPVPAGEYWDKLASMLAASAPPDVFWMNAQNFGRFAPNGQLLDLGPLVRRDRVDLSDFWPVSIQLYSFKGGPHALTSQYDSRGLFFNKALFDQAGVRYPPASYRDPSWTWEMFLDTARRLTRTAGNVPVWGCHIPTGYIHTTPWVWSGGGDLLNTEKTECIMTQPGTVEAFQFLADLMHVHRVAPTPAELRTAGASALQLFQRGQLGMIQVHSANVVEGRLVKDFPWDAAPLPRGKAGPAMQASGPAWAIGAASRNHEEAWALVKHLTSPESQRQLAMGGAALVGRRSVVEAVYRESREPPANAQVFVEGMAYVRPDPFTPNWADIERAMNEELRSLWEGERGARETMAAIKPRVDALLRELQR